jgi:hypothetical protein
MASIPASSIIRESVSADLSDDSKKFLIERIWPSCQYSIHYLQSYFDEYEIHTRHEHQDSSCDRVDTDEELLFFVELLKLNTARSQIDLKMRLLNSKFYIR